MASGPATRTSSRICHDSTLACAGRAAHGLGRLPSRASCRRRRRDGWSSPPLTPAGLRGKVVLAGFWTYTCINWLRQLPYLRAWAGKYAGHGLVVIGVHTPSSPSSTSRQRPPRGAGEADRLPGRDRQRLRGLDRLRQPLLACPLPRRRARPHPAPPLGEGQYQQSEMVLQQLLAQAGSAGAGDELVAPDARGAEAPADRAALRSP